DDRSTQPLDEPGPHRVDGRHGDVVPRSAARHAAAVLLWKGADCPRRAMVGMRSGRGPRRVPALLPAVLALALRTASIHRGPEPQRDAGSLMGVQRPSGNGSSKKGGREAALLRASIFARTNRRSRW